MTRRFRPSRAMRRRGHRAGRPPARLSIWLFILLALVVVAVGLARTLPGP